MQVVHRQTLPQLRPTSFASCFFVRNDKGDGVVAGRETDLLTCNQAAVSMKQTGDLVQGAAGAVDSPVCL